MELHGTNEWPKTNPGFGKKGGGVPGSDCEVSALLLATDASCISGRESSDNSKSVSAKATTKNANIPNKAACFKVV